MNLTRVGLFIDGGYLITVSNYYAYAHHRRTRLAIQGIMDFACEFVADKLSVPPSLCQVATAHYYRGRLAAPIAAQRDVTEKERAFDDLLSKLGIHSHYLPLVHDAEKGIDVWFALDVFDMAIRKDYDVAVLITADGDFVPLIHKLNSQGMPSVLMTWELGEHSDKMGNIQASNVSRALIEKATYSVSMHKIIDDPDNEYSHKADSLFVPRSYQPDNECDRNVPVVMPKQSGSETEELYRGVIGSLYPSFGFLQRLGTDESIFFHSSEPNFMNLRIGDVVEFTLGHNTQGPCARKIRILS